MNRNECEQLLDSGLFTLGAHTLTHPILHNETRDVAFQEIAESKARLSRMFGGEIHYFAYPNGKKDLDFGAREFQMLRENGYRLAFTTDAQFFKGDAPFAIPRSGFAGTPRENRSWVLGKLFLTPVWDRIHQAREENQRREIGRVVARVTA